MLMDAQATSTYFRGFTEHMPVLCDSLSISPFDAGETILQEGEEGTWLGVLLKGSCARSNKQSCSATPPGCPMPPGCNPMPPGCNPTPPGCNSTPPR